MAEAGLRAMRDKTIQMTGAILRVDELAVQVPDPSVVQTRPAGASPQFTRVLQLPRKIGLVIETENAGMQTLVRMPAFTQGTDSMSTDSG